jgi:hypothetical protein
LLLLLSLLLGVLCLLQLRLQLHAHVLLAAVRSPGCLSAFSCCRRCCCY